MSIIKAGAYATYRMANIQSNKIEVKMTLEFKSFLKTNLNTFSLLVIVQMLMKGNQPLKLQNKIFSSKTDGGKFVTPGIQLTFVQSKQNYFNFDLIIHLWFHNCYSFCGSTLLIRI